MIKTPIIRLIASWAVWMEPSAVRRVVAPAGGWCALRSRVNNRVRARATTAAPRRPIVSSFDCKVIGSLKALKRNIPAKPAASPSK